MKLVLFLLSMCAALAAADSAAVVPPNTFIWSVPRSGSTLLLNSLGNSGYWNRSNILCEPFNAAIGVVEPHWLGQNFLSAQDMVDSVSSRGPFLWKDHPFSLRDSWAAPHRHPFLKDKDTKHIFITRNPVDSVRGVAVGVVKGSFFPTLNPAFTDFFVRMGFDTEDIQAWLDFAGGHIDQKILYRYLNDVVGAHILFVDVEDLWEDPQTALRSIASFIGVEYTDDFMSWDGPSFDAPESLSAWFEVIKKSKGWIPRKKGEAAAKSTAGTTASIGEGILPDDWLAAMTKTTDKQMVAYRWLQEHVPASQRMGSYAEPSSKTNSDEL